MQCSMRHASSDATSASTPASRSIPSKKRCLASASSAIGSEPRVAVDDVNKALLCQVGKRLGHARLGDAHMLSDIDVSAAPALGADGEDLLEVALGGITDAEDRQNPRQNPDDSL